MICDTPVFFVPQVEYDESRKDFYLCDLGSLNGTYMQMVSGSMIAQTVRRRENGGTSVLFWRVSCR